MHPMPTGAVCVHVYIVCMHTKSQRNEIDFPAQLIRSIMTWMQMQLSESSLRALLHVCRYGVQCILESIFKYVRHSWGAKFD